MKIRRAFVATILMLATMPFPALACMVGYDFDEDIVSRTDTIMTGKIKSLTPILSSDNINYAGVILTFEVDNALIGTSNSEVSVLWQNSTYGVPTTLDDFTREQGVHFIFGIVDSDWYSWPTHYPEFKQWYRDKGLLDIPWMAQDDCHPPFMFSQEKNSQKYANFKALKP